MNIQGWFPLRLTSLVLLSKGLSRVFSSTTLRRHQFFGPLNNLPLSAQLLFLVKRLITILIRACPQLPPQRHHTERQLAWWSALWALLARPGTLGLSSWVYYSKAMWPKASYLTCLCFHVFICKMEIIIEFHKGTVGIKWLNTPRTHRTRLHEKPVSGYRTERMKDGQLHGCLGAPEPMQSEPGLFPLPDLPLSQAVPTISSPRGKAHFPQRAGSPQAGPNAAVSLSKSSFSPKLACPQSSLSPHVPETIWGHGRCSINGHWNKQTSNSCWKSDVRKKTTQRPFGFHVYLCVVFIDWFTDIRLIYNTM